MSLDKPQLNTAFNASAWLLERKHPKTYSKNIVINTKEDAFREQFAEMRDQVLKKTIKELERTKERNKGRGKDKHKRRKKPNIEVKNTDSKNETNE